MKPKGLSPKEKSAIQRGLFGYKFSQRIKSKLYSGKKKGAVNKEEYRLGNGVIMVPSTMENKILEILKNNRAKYRSQKIWT